MKEVTFIVESIFIIFVAVTSFVLGFYLFNRDIKKDFQYINKPIIVNTISNSTPLQNNVSEEIKIGEDVVSGESQETVKKYIYQNTHKEDIVYADPVEQIQTKSPVVVEKEEVKKIADGVSSPIEYVTINGITVDKRYSAALMEQLEATRIQNMSAQSVSQIQYDNNVQQQKTNELVNNPSGLSKTEINELLKKCDLWDSESAAAKLENDRYIYLIAKFTGDKEDVEYLKLIDRKKSNDYLIGTNTEKSNSNKCSIYRNK